MSIGNQRKATNPLLSDKNFDVIISYFSGGDNVRGVNRFSTSMVTHDRLDGTLATIDSSGYKDIASANIGNLFAPFTTIDDGSMPYVETSGTIAGDIHGSQLIPFQTTSNSNRLDRFIDPSGDSMRSITGGEYRGSTVRYVDTSGIRSIGLRMPIIAVGWGYDTDGNPVPAASGDASKFAGDFDDGYMVDPKEYVAAPIDLRYDNDRKVWSINGMQKHRHLLDTSQDGGPAFASFFADSLEEASGLGYLEILPSLAGLS